MARPDDKTSPENLAPETDPDRLAPEDLPDLWKTLKAAKGLWNPKTANPVRAMWRGLTSSSFFWPSKALAIWLAELGYSEPSTDKFLDYSAWKQHYYTSGNVFQLKLAGTLRRFRVPYLECAGRLGPDDPPKLWIRGGVGHYSMPPSLKQRTQAAFDAFVKEKPKTTDGPILRLGLLEGEEVVLERASYFDQVRTNLTLDFAPASVHASTLRVADLVNGGLPAFHDSKMVNTIGASAVVSMPLGDGKIGFFVKRKTIGQGVFANMLGTVSGVVNYFDGQPVAELWSHAAWSILREFERETGLNAENLKLEIKPLAFCRELTRGGKPQFFFLLSIPKTVDERTLRTAFGSSAEGLDEFHHNSSEWLTGALVSPSPEFACNWLYAVRYIARAAGGSGNDSDIIVLPRSLS